MHIISLIDRIEYYGLNLKVDNDLQILIKRSGKGLRKMGNSTMELNESNFDKTIESGLTLVDMYANWCMPCRMLAPTISTLATEYEGKVKVGKLNIDEAPSIASKYGVMSIPTVILFKDGKQIAQKVGMGDKSSYDQMIQAAK